MNLPAKEKKIDFTCVGSITKQEFKGAFTIKILTALERSRVEVRVDYLNMGVVVPNAMSAIYHKKLSHVQFAIKESPEWWSKTQGEDLLDDNIVQALYEQVIAFENEWYESIWGK